MKIDQKRLSIPYNNDFSGTVKLMEKYKNYISEIYFPINPNIIGSGRGGSSQYFYDEFTKALILKAKEHDIKSNLIINAFGSTEIFADEKKYNAILSYIDYYCNVLGVDFVTVTNPILAKRIPSIAVNAKVVASVNMFLNSFEAIKRVMQLGVKEIYIDRELNWDLNFIKNIKKNFNIKVRLMLNEGCLPSCALKYTHFDCVGIMKSEEEMEKYREYEKRIIEHGCLSLYSKDLSLFLKTPVVRPEDIKYYEPYIDTFKVVGRISPTSLNDLRIRAYGEGSYRGDLSLIIDNPVARRVLSEKGLVITNSNYPDDYFDKKTRCSKICSSCNYCASVAKKVIEKVL